MIDRLERIAGRFAIAFVLGQLVAYAYDRLEAHRARVRALERIATLATRAFRG